jgi:hypothetical protein
MNSGSTKQSDEPESINDLTLNTVATDTAEEIEGEAEVVGSIERKT